MYATEVLEDVLNYIRVNLMGIHIIEIDLDFGLITFRDVLGINQKVSITKIYTEILDKREKI